MSDAVSLAEYAKDLPHPVNVLVQRLPGTRKEYAWVAMCLQFSIEGKAATPKDSITRALANLAQYLHDCAKHKAESFSAAPDLFQQSFYKGRPMKIDHIDLGGAHVRVRVLDHGKASWAQREVDEEYIDLDVRSPLDEPVAAGLH